jgi:CRP-like cAMP-binding protein
MSDQSSTAGGFESHPFLQPLSERHRMLLASGARPFTAAAGIILARQGTQADSFYLVQSGHVALTAGGTSGVELPITTVGPGEVVGWSWLIPPYRWQFTCRAVDDVRGIAFNTEWLREMCERDYSLGYDVLRQLVTVMATRLTATRRQLTELQHHRGPSST